MKKYIHIIIEILTLSILLQATPVFAAEETTEYLYTVSGYALSHLEGQTVTVNVFYPGKSAADLGTLPNNEVIAYHSQEKTGENGFFEITFSVPERGEYTANARVMGEENLRVINAEEKVPEYTGTPIFSMDFEEIPSGLYISGAVQSVPTDAEHGKSLALTPKSGKNVLVWKTLENQIDDGVYLIEYDTSFTRTDNYSYFRVSNDKNQMSMRNYVFEGAVFNDSAALGYYNQCRGFSVIPCREYSKDTWYNVKTWLDFDRAMVYYYVDGQFMSQTPMHPDMMKRVCGMGFVSERDTGGVQYIDNFSLKELDYSLIRSLNEAEVPEHLLNSLQISASGRVTGNIYFNNKETFYWNLNNISNRAETLNITYELINSDGKEVMTKTDRVDISAKTESEQSVSLEFDKFGFYKMKITAENENVFAQKELELSYVHGANSLSGMGVCTHFAQGKGEASKLMPLLEKMGVGFIRDECYWSEYEKTKGVYKLPESYDKVIDEANSRGIEVLQLLTYSNALYGSGAPWENDSVLAGFEEYCYHLALDLKGRVKYFEVWNEYNLNNAAGTDGYVKLLKAGYNGVKRANPDAIVVATTPLDVGTSWMDSIFPALGGERYMDIIACHPYNEFIPESSNPDWGYAGKFEIAHTKMEQYGYGDLPIWATELGWQSNDFAGQAEYIVRLSLLNEAHNSNGRMMDKMFFYDFQNDGVNSDEKEHNFGMIKAWKGTEVPYAAKESYIGAANYNAILGNAELVAYSEKSGGDYIYQFQKEGKTIYALWNINGEEKQISLPIAESEAVLYDFYGNAQTLIPQNGVVSVKIDGKPVYLKLGVQEPEIDISSGGKSVESLSDIPDGGLISVHAENAAENSEFYAAAYKDGYLLDVVSASGRNGFLDIEKKYGCDNIKVFLWENGTPLVKNVNLIGE